MLWLLGLPVLIVFLGCIKDEQPEFDFRPHQHPVAVAVDVAEYPSISASFIEASYNYYPGEPLADTSPYASMCPCDCPESDAERHLRLTLEFDDRLASMQHIHRVASRKALLEDRRQKIALKLAKKRVRLNANFMMRGYWAKRMYGTNEIALYVPGTHAPPAPQRWRAKVYAKHMRPVVTAVIARSKTFYPRALAFAWSHIIRLPWLSVKFQIRRRTASLAVPAWTSHLGRHSPCPHTLLRQKKACINETQPILTASQRWRKTSAQYLQPVIARSATIYDSARPFTWIHFTLLQWSKIKIHIRERTACLHTWALLLARNSPRLATIFTCATDWTSSVVTHLSPFWNDRQPHTRLAILRFQIWIARQIPRLAHSASRVWLLIANGLASLGRSLTGTFARPIDILPFQIWITRQIPRLAHWASQVWLWIANGLASLGRSSTGPFARPIELLKDMLPLSISWGSEIGKVALLLVLDVIHKLSRMSWFTFATTSASVVLFIVLLWFGFRKYRNRAAVGISRHAPSPVAVLRPPHPSRSAKHKNTSRPGTSSSSAKAVIVGQSHGPTHSQIARMGSTRNVGHSRLQPLEGPRSPLEHRRNSVRDPLAESEVSVPAVGQSAPKA